MRGVVIETAQPADLAKRALSARLFVNGWTLSRDLSGFDPTRDYIALATCDGVPVGVCICCSVGFISIFVRKAYRRRGIGTDMASKVRAIYDADTPEFPIEAGYGIQGSVKFWDSVQIPCN